MSENDFFEKYNKSLVKVGARSLYHKAVKIYTEAVVNETPLKPDSLLAQTFNNPIYLKAKDKTTSILGHQVDNLLLPEYIDSFVENINFKYKPFLDSTAMPSHEFLKDQYAAYEIPEPPDGFFDINHGVTNWWEKTTQYKNGFFSKVFALQTDLKKKELILSSNFKVESADFPINYDKLITSLKYQKLRAKLVTDTIVSFVSHGLFEEDLETGFSHLPYDVKAHLIEHKDLGIKDNYFLFLQPGFKLKPNPDNKSATLFIRVFFDVFGASTALSLADITGFTEPPKVPTGVRKSFSVKNFQKGLDSVKKYIKQVKKSKKNKGLLPLDVPELLLENSKTLKDIFKKIVKDNGLGSHSTVTFVFKGDEDELFADLEFLALVDGNNITLKSGELKTLLNTNITLNNAICVLNYINCFIGGNAEEEEEEDESSPFSLGSPPPTQEEIATAHKKQKSKTKFAGDPSLKSSLKSLKHSGGKTIASSYNQFYNRVDVAGVSSFAKQDLASIVPEDQVKKIIFQAYIESLEVSEIIDCVLISVKNTPFYDPLQMAMYAPFSFFYNAAKLDDPETFNFIDEATPLPTIAKYIPEDFPYITMIPEEQKAKVFSTIVNNNPQYRNSPELNNEGLVEISKRPDFAPEDFITLAIRRSVVNFALKTLPLAAPVEEKKEEEPKKPKSPEELEYDKATKAMNKASGHAAKLQAKAIKLLQKTDKGDGEPDFSNQAYKDASLAHEKAWDEWEKLRDIQEKAKTKWIKTLPKVDQESKKTKLDFDHLFTLVSKNNKKLRDSFKPGKPYSNDDLKVYRSQQKSLSKVNKIPSFGWYSATTPPLSHNAFISVLIGQAKEQAMLAILKGMADAAKSGTDKQMNGNPDALDRLDGAAAALIGSNDPLQNVIDSTGNNFNSPQDAMSAIGASLFPNASAAEIKCFFTAFASEVNFFTQAKLFKNPSNTNDPDFEIVRGILERCGLPSTDNIVIELLVKLSQLIDQDLLELKLKEMKEAMLEYLDVCEDPNANYIDNLRRFLDDQSAKDQAKGESDAAAKKLLDLLSMFDENKIKNLGPQLYCKQGYRGPVVFDDHYSETSLEAQDKLMTSYLKNTNRKFNSDIGKFKPTILNQSFDNPLAKMGLNLTDKGGDISDSKFGKFLNGDKDALSNDEKPTVIEDLLTDVINKKLLFNSSGFTITQDANEDNLKYYRLKFGINDEIYYYIFLNKGAAIKDWKLNIWEGIPLDFEKKSISTLMVDTASKYAEGDLKIIIEHKKIAEYVDTEKTVHDLLFNADKYDPKAQASESDTLDSFYLTLNESATDDERTAKDNILLKLYGILTDQKDMVSPDFAASLEARVNFFLDGTLGDVGASSVFVRSIFQNVFSGVVSRLVDGLIAFDDEVFSMIPFKDNAAKTIFSEGEDSKKFYTDGGLISAPEIFEDFKVIRKNIQCYIEFGSSPDSFQIAKLSSLYQTLFNTVIVQQMLNFYFSLVVGLEQKQLFSLNKEENKLIIMSSVQNAFNNALVKTNNLSVNYERDLQKIYKYQQLLDGQKPVNEPPTSDIITYYVDRYYGTIMKKMQKRMSLGLSTSKSEKFLTTFDSIKDLFGVSTPLPIYSQGKIRPLHVYQSAEDGTYNYTDSPVYRIDTEKDGKLYNGFIIQNYVDIRQTFGEAKQFETVVYEENNKTKTKEEEFSARPMNFLTSTWRAEPNQDDLDKTDWKKILKAPLPLPPEAQLSNADQGSNDFTLNPNDIYQDYKDNYLRTQGKISLKDFKRYYYDPFDRAPADPKVVEANTLLINNDVATFLEKAAVGQRLCLVLDSSDPIAQNLFNVISNDVFRHNVGPSLSTEQFFEQVRTLFNEKVFIYGETEGKTVNRLKIVIPLISFEKNFLDDYKFNPLEDFKVLYKKMIDYHNGDMVKDLASNPLMSLLYKNLLKGALDPAMFNDLVLVNMKEALIGAYGKKLTTIFDPTINTILSQIGVASSSSDSSQTDSDATADSPFSSDIDDGGIDWPPLLAASLPILIQALANFADPTWRTPWFYPGPITPVGFLAKILKPF